MNLQSMKIGPRLGLGFALVLALCMAMGWVGFSSLAKQGAYLDAIGGNILPSIKTLGEMQLTLTEYRRRTLRATFASSDEARTKAVGQMQAARESLRNDNQVLRAVPPPPAAEDAS